ncbi:hypothetical protein AB0C33_01890 [Nonomuraea sp. NPDC048881]|uniref:hypothetical protein n=1 Tax=Nonomuraea sp. NPDC048881 TaxID=3155030 RepID=UPI0033F1925E
MHDRILLQQIFFELTDGVNEKLLTVYEERTGKKLSMETLKRLFADRQIGTGVTVVRGMGKVRWDITVPLVREDPWIILYPKRFTDQYNARADKKISRYTLSRWLQLQGVRVAHQSAHWDEELLIALANRRGKPYVIPEELA